MASNRDARQLTEQHRLTQIRIGNVVMHQVLTAWPALDPTRLDATFPVFLQRMREVVGAYRRVSFEQSLAYYQAFRRAEAKLPHAELGAALGDLPDRQLLVSLLATGPARIKTLMARGAALAEALSRAQVGTAQTVQRHVLHAGRRALVDASAADRAAIGFARVTGGSPCAFCAMLASRGPVHTSRAHAAQTSGVRGSRPAGRAFHDGCGCTVEPVFSSGASWPPHSTRFDELWASSTAGTSGAAALAAFRKALAG